MDEIWVIGRYSLLLLRKKDNSYLFVMFKEKRKIFEFFFLMFENYLKLIKVKMICELNKKKNEINIKLYIDVYFVLII